MLLSFRANLVELLFGLSGITSPVLTFQASRPDLGLLLGKRLFCVRCCPWESSELRKNEVETNVNSEVVGDLDGMKAA